jgi:glycosyltransferase involved in cell wall biosynthesis
VAFILSSGESFLSTGLQRIIAEKYYEERFPKALKILNYPIRSEEKESVVSAPDRVDDFDPEYNWYLYTGNVSLDRGALTHLNQLQANPKAALCYVGRCSSHIAERVKERQQAIGIDSSRIRIIGVGEYVSRETIHHLTKTGPWIAGLALFPDTPHYQRKELTKFFEYMEAGLPILASNFAVWTQMIDGQTGFTVDPSDPIELKRRSLQLESDPALRRRFGAVGQAQVAQDYNWQRQEEKLVDLYNELVIV